MGDSGLRAGLIASTGASLSLGRDTYHWYFGGKPPREGLYRIFVSPGIEEVRWFIGGEWDISADEQPTHWLPLGELMNVEKSKWWWEMQVSENDLAKCDAAGRTVFTDGDEAGAIKLHGHWVQFLRPLLEYVLIDGREAPMRLLSKKRPTGMPDFADIPFPTGTNSAVDAR